MWRREFMLGGALSLIAGGAQANYKRIAYRYDGPEITQVYVDKTARKMYLMADKKVIKKFNIHLGFNPEGHKQAEGDGRTPEGLYFIDRRNSNSRYYLSLGISYPNADDRARAHAAGVSPGGEIFIHGGPRYRGEKGRKDWTAGCIAVTDKEMRWIWSMVQDNTPIYIAP